MFEQIDGLPLHPLVVHLVLVLVPLSALGAVLVAARPRWARTYGPIVAVLAVAAAVAALVAQQAGDALAAQFLYTSSLEEIEQHGRWGLFVVNLSIAFAVTSVVSVVLAFTAAAGTRWQVVAGWLAAALGVAATVFAFLAGETGAASVWGYVYGVR